MYGLLLFSMPILVVVILIQVFRIDKKLKDLSETKDPNVETLKSLSKKEIISNHEVDEKVKLYKERNEKEILLNLYEEGIFNKDEYERIIAELEEIKKLAHSPQLKRLSEKMNDESIVCFPEEDETSWKCVCGTANQKHQQNCGKCHLNKEYVFNQYNGLKH